MSLDTTALLLDFDAQTLALSNGADVTSLPATVGGVTAVPGAFLGGWSGINPTFATQGINGFPAIDFSVSTGFDTLLFTQQAGTTTESLFVICQDATDGVTQDAGPLLVGHPFIEVMISGNKFYYGLNFAADAEFTPPLRLRRKGIPALYSTLRNGSSIRAFLNNVELVRTDVNTVTDTLLLKGFGGTLMKMGRALCYTATKSDGEAVAIRSTLFTQWRSEKTLILCDGNSLCEGSGASDAAHAYPGVLSGLLGTTDFTVRNLGVGGQTTVQMSSDAPVQIDSEANAFFTQSIVVANELINDVVFGGATDVTAMDHYKTYCLARRQAGHFVIATTPHRTNFGTDALGQSGQTYIPIWRAIINDSANLGVYWDEVADITATPELGNPGAEDNLTYYQADAVHLTDAGYAVWASVVQGAVNRLISSLTAQPSLIGSSGLSGDTLGGVGLSS